MLFDWLVSLLVLHTCSARRHPHEHGPLSPDETFQFITRPDIKAPRWVVTKFDESRISPGHWFVAPFERLAQKQGDYGYGAVGPHIYDGDGELVWSGVSTFRGRNVLDFKLSNIDGEEMLTFIYQEDGNGVILDNSYEIKKVVDIGEPETSSNPQEFLFIENGTRALITTQHRESVSKPLVKISNRGKCDVLWQGFKEIDVATWQPVFQWESRDYIGLNESTFTKHEDHCDALGGWDYVHINSADKLPSGDYLLSGRHTDTIYRISAQDGSIAWRLGGILSDFDIEEGSKFSRQHDVRFRGQNETHMLISFLDNARGEDSKKPSNWFSRGILMTLDLVNKRATIEHRIEHPEGPGRWARWGGNYQELGSGNTFMCWSEEARHSEHASDGTKLLQANLVTRRLGTFRAYKFPFVGKPTTSPDVRSAAYAGPNGSATTVVHVSWNGATEVDAWNLYKTTEGNRTMVLIASRRRLGFETALAYEGFAAYVIIEAIGKDGSALASSAVIRTELPRKLNAAVAGEVLWLQKMENGQGRVPTLHKSASKRSLVPFVFGFICSVVAMLVAILVSRKTGTVYAPSQGSLKDESEDRDEDRDGLPK